MKATFALILAASTAFSAGANELDPKFTECLALQKTDERLACYDRQTGFQPKEAPKVEQRPAVRWKVRDSGTVSPVGAADIGSKAGQFQIGDSDGKNFTTAKVGIVGVGRAINRPGGFFDGWEPFFGLSWDRDTSAKVPKDLRQYVVGITGQVFAPPPGGTTAMPTVRFGYRDEKKAHTSGGFANLHVDIIHLPWVTSPEGPGLNAPAFVPFLGVLTRASNASPGATTDGTYTGLYLGAKYELKLGAIVERLSASAQAQYFKEVAAPGANDKLRMRYVSVGLKYDLVDPKATSGWVPSLSLTHQHGTDPVSGEGPAKKTTLALGVKFD